MDLFFVMATAVVALLILYFVRPELSDEGSLLRRWSRDNAGDTVIFPPVTGMAMEHPVMWLGAVINLAAFAAGANLVRQCMSDTSLVNLVLTGRGD